MHHIENKSSLLNQGDMFIIPPGKTHYIAPEPDTVFYAFSFMPNLLGEQNQNNRLALNFLRNLQTDKNIHPKITVESEDIFYIETVMERMLSEFNTKPIGFSEVIHSYAILLITVLARNYYEKEKSNISDYFESNKQFVLHCIKYIENNFTDNICLNEISKRSAMSKSSFCKLFSELTGHSFNNYLNICRIKKATELIKSGYKITAVYGLCGYNDFSTFYRNFRKITGVSPKVYKRNNL